MRCWVQVSKLHNSCSGWVPSLSSPVESQMSRCKQSQQTCPQVCINNAGDVQIGFINGCLLHNSIRCHLMEDCNDLSRGNSVALQAGLLGFTVFPCYCTVTPSAGITTCMACATMMHMSFIGSPVKYLASQPEAIGKPECLQHLKRPLRSIVCTTSSHWTGSAVQQSAVCSWHRAVFWLTNGLYMHALELRAFCLSLSASHMPRDSCCSSWVVDCSSIPSNGCPEYSCCYF